MNNSLLRSSRSESSTFKTINSDAINLVMQVDMCHTNSFHLAIMHNKRFASSSRKDSSGMPSEVVSLILKQLHHRDILRCSLVCRWFQGIIVEDPTLQYLIALAKYGFVDGSHGRFAVGERIRLLLDQQARWRSLTWFGATENRVPSAEILAYTDGTLVQRVEGTVAKQRGAVIHICQTTSWANAASWRLPLVLAFPVVAASIDPACDLLVLVEMHKPNDPDGEDGTTIRLHLIKATPTVSGWVPHPHARKAVLGLGCGEPGKENCQVFSLRIVGSRLMVNVGDPLYFSSLYILDWTTGTFLVERTPSMVSNMYDEMPFQVNLDLNGITPGAWCFADMLSPDTLIVAHYMPTYTFSKKPRREEVSCGIEVMRIRPERVGANLVHLVTLMLPVPVRTFEIKPDITAGPCSPHPDPRAPFSCDPSSRIIVIDLGNRESVVAPCIVVPQRTLISLAEKCDAEDAGCPMTVPWEEWGPQNTRVLETARSDGSPRAVRAIHGERGVFAVVDAAGRRRTCILDFNVCTAYPSRTRLVTRPSTVHSKYFKEPITSRLPYYETAISEMPGDPEVVYCLDDKRLVQVERCIQPRSGDFDTVTVHFV